MLISYCVAEMQRKKKISFQRLKPKSILNVFLTGPECFIIATFIFFFIETCQADTFILYQLFIGLFQQCIPVYSLTENQLSLVCPHFFFLLLLYLAGEYLIHMSNSYKTYQKYHIVLNLSTLQTLIRVPGAKHQTHRLIGLEPVTNVTKDHPVITPDICSHQTHSQGQQQPHHSPYCSDNSPRQHWSLWNCPKFALVEVELQTSSLN